MNLSDVLIKPLITEKTTLLKETPGQVAFLVNPDANKIEIGAAVEKAFNVKVLEVNVVRRRPRSRKRQGKIIGQKPGWKKAYILLAPGEKIEMFDGV